MEAAKAFLIKNSGEFKRTPKYALKKKIDDWKNKKYQVPLQKIVLLEFAMAILGAGSLILAAQTHNYGMIPILAQFTIAYASIVVLSLFQSKKEIA